MTLCPTSAEGRLAVTAAMEGSEKTVRSSVALGREVTPAESVTLTEMAKVPAVPNKQVTTAVASPVQPGSNPLHPYETYGRDPNCAEEVKVTDCPRSTELAEGCGSRATGSALTSTEMTTRLQAWSASVTLSMTLKLPAASGRQSIEPFTAAAHPRAELEFVQLYRNPPAALSAPATMEIDVPRSMRAGDIETVTQGDIQAQVSFSWVPELLGFPPKRIPLPSAGS